jgi:deoxyadenosine/deoxycytidine kinase
MVLLEGNIGAGKSTVGRVLRASGLFAFIEEPVDMWQTGFASNLLAAFYQDMERWSFTFQILAFITRAKTWQEILARTNHSRVVLERSIFTDRHVFATNMHNIGAMTETEWQVYCGLWDFLASNYCVEPDAILYLRTPAEVCQQRIWERDRSEESGIGLGYLKQLEALHDNWLLDHPRAIVLDGTKRWSAEEVFEQTRPLCGWVEVEPFRRSG